MTTKRFSRLVGPGAAAAAMLWSTPGTSAQTVRAVMFYSPTCPHCEQVIRQDLPVFFGMYGGDPQAYTDEAAAQNQRYLFLFSNGQLEVLLINAALRGGGQLFEASLESHGRSSGVPRLILGSDVLIGSIEIPTRLHDLIQAGLERGGVDWPSIPGLPQALAGIPQAAPLAQVAVSDSVTPDSAVLVEEPSEPSQEAPESLPAAPDTQPRQTQAPVTPRQEPSAPTGPDTSRTVAVDTTTPDTAGAAVERRSDPTPPTRTTLESVAAERPSMLQNFRNDPVGNGLSVLVLIGMIASLVIMPRYARPEGQEQSVGLAIPLLSVVGIAVAAYLTYIEVGQVIAVCGPVGDCNTVNQSEYAKLFGVIPVGALGLAGYVAIIATWLAGRYAAAPMSNRGTVALFAGTLFGTLFSVYLTFLEPFVIGATCAWCLSSAVIMTLLMWFSAKPAAEAWVALREERNHEPGTVGSLDGGA